MRSYEGSGGGSSGVQAFFWFAALLALALGIISVVVGSVALSRADALATSVTGDTSALDAQIAAFTLTVTQLNETIVNATGSALNVTVWPLLTQPDGDFGWGAAAVANWEVSVISRGIGSLVDSVTLQAVATTGIATTLTSGDFNPWVVNHGGDGLLQQSYLEPRFDIPSTTWFHCDGPSLNRALVLGEVNSNGDLSMVLYNQTGTGFTPLFGPFSIPADWQGQNVTCVSVVQLTWYQLVPANR